MVGVVLFAAAGAAKADGIGNAGDDLRTGWYPDESSLTQQLVSGNTFGQLWSTAVNGQVYAQPLLSPNGTKASPSGMLVVATENDKVYGLDPVNGAQQWTADLGTPFDPSTISCPDITPSIGTTSTPVIDASTNTVYLTHKAVVNGQAKWFMDALDIATGQEKNGWPVELTTGNGYADNAQVTFFPRTQQQRPGLLLMNGVVYAAFGSHCDVQPWQGWVFGVSTTSAQITAKWVDDTSNNGAGIWQAGAGLTSDGPGRILLATGNGGAPSAPAAGSDVPSACGECVMRLQVQSDGTLKPVDFFAPYDASTLDQSDSDFGSGGVVALPDQYFGTPAFPHLAVSVGKEGYVYLLNRDGLGGYDQGSGGGDNVLQRIGPRGGVWGRAGVWPGDGGGYVYLTTSTGSSSGGLLDVYKYGVNGSGAPSLALAGSASDVFGWGSGSPVITSDGTNSGSAIVWVMWSANRQGQNGQLRAYSALPVNAQLQLLGSWSIGTATNYFSPGVGAGRIYVGTRDGKVVAFGSPTPQPLGGSGLTFPRTTVGSSSGPQTLMMKATRTVTISSLVPSNSQFSLGTPSQSVPATLNAGDTLSVPVTFTPSQTGPVAGQLTASTTDAGDVSFSLSGTGQAQQGLLDAYPAFLSLGGTAVGGELTGTVTFTNDGAGALKISGFTPPSAAGTSFTASNAPNPGYQLQPGASVTVDISFDPKSVGQYSDTIVLSATDSQGQNPQSQTVGLSASASTPGLLQFSSQAVDFGNVAVGTTATKTFTISNAGGTTVTIEKSKPPYGGAFTATSSLPEGIEVGPGKTVTETVTFTPTTPGPASGAWAITGDDGSGPHQVQFTGTGVSPSSTSGSPSGPSSGGPSATTSGAKPRPVLPVAPKLVPTLVSTTRLGGVYVTYTARAAGVSRFVLERAMPGRRGAHGCIPATSRNRTLPACTRYVVLARFTHRDRAASNRLRLTAYVPARRLPAGTYRLLSIMLDSAGGKHTLYSALRIVVPSRRQGASRWGGPRSAPATALDAPLAAALAELIRRLSVV